MIFYLSWTQSSNNLLLAEGKKQAESFYTPRSHIPTSLYAWNGSIVPLKPDVYSQAVWVRSATKITEYTAWVLETGRLVQPRVELASVMSPTSYLHKKSTSLLADTSSVKANRLQTLPTAPPGAVPSRCSFRHSGPDYSPLHPFQMNRDYQLRNVSSIEWHARSRNCGGSLGISFSLWDNDVLVQWH